MDCDDCKGVLKCRDVLPDPAIAGSGKVAKLFAAQGVKIIVLYLRGTPDHCVQVFFQVNEAPGQRISFTGR